MPGTLIPMFVYIFFINALTMHTRVLVAVITAIIVYVFVQALVYFYRTSRHYPSRNSVT